ncbi:TPA: hypothetical protein ACGOYX_001423 [Streptococcus suis]
MKKILTISLCLLFMFIFNNNTAFASMTIEEVKPIFKEHGIEFNDYYEDTSPSMIDIRFLSKKYTENYKNFTVEEVNGFFSQSPNLINIKSILEKFGGPDIIWINNGMHAFSIQMWWESDIAGYYTSVYPEGSEEWAKYKSIDTDFIFLKLSVFDDHTAFEVSGVPSDSEYGMQSFYDTSRDVPFEKTIHNYLEKEN